MQADGWWRRRLQIPREDMVKQVSKVHALNRISTAAEQVCESACWFRKARLAIVARQAPTRMMVHVACVKCTKSVVAVPPTWAV